MMRIDRITAKNGKPAATTTIAQNPHSTGTFRSGVLRVTSCDDNGRVYRATISTDEIAKSAYNIRVEALSDIFGSENIMGRLREFQLLLDKLAQVP